MNMNTSKNYKGQSLVETALVIPLVLLLIFTFLDLGRGIYYFSALSNAVREGARFASVTPIDYSSDTEKADVKSKVIGYSVAVNILSNDIGVVSDGEEVTVSASYDFTPITPFLAQMLGSGTIITLNSESTMLLAPIARN